MPDELGSEPITDDEVLYRRVPVSRNWFTSNGLSPEAFDPRVDDRTGLSFVRGKYKPVEDAAKGPAKQGYYVAICSMQQIRASGLTCVPSPLQDEPGHAEIIDVRFDNRESDETLERKMILARLFGDDVRGPFLSR